MAVAEAPTEMKAMNPWNISMGVWLATSLRRFLSEPLPLLSFWLSSSEYSSSE